jgi:hypothetical protein
VDCLAFILDSWAIMFVIPMLNTDRPLGQNESVQSDVKSSSGLPSYAADHEGNFPPTLGALYPDYVPNLDLFFSKEEGNRKRIVIYHPGLTEISPGGLPLLEYPVRYRGKRVIAHCGGYVKLVVDENVSIP